MTISCETPDAVIRYTTDGTEPTSSHGAIVTGPIPITTTTCLRAAAFKNGWLASNVDTQTYVFVAHAAKLSQADADKLVQDLLQTGETQWSEIQSSIKESIRAGLKNLDIGSRAEIIALKGEVTKLKKRVSELEKAQTKAE